MSRSLFLQLLLLGLFVSILVAANAGGSKLIAFGPLAASATVFAYAISFLITDITCEVFGKEVARAFVIAGFVGVLLAAIFFRVAVVAPPAPFYSSQEAFELVFQTSPRLLAGGLAGYLVSQFFDVRFYHYLKRLTRGRHMWLRNNVSTLSSQFIDTSIFIFIAFYGIVEELLMLILGQYVIKVLIAILDTPVLYGAVFLVNKGLRLAHEVDD